MIRKICKIIRYFKYLARFLITFVRLQIFYNTYFYYIILTFIIYYYIRIIIYVSFRYLQNDMIFAREHDRVRKAIPFNQYFEY